MFRNLRFYRVTSPWPATEQELSESLSVNEFTPCGSFAERSAGWEAPVMGEEAPLCRRLNGADLLLLRTQSRVLPVAAIKEALEERVVEFQQRMQSEPNRAELRRLKEETRDKLLPKSLVKSERSRACFLHAESLLVIDAATESKAEWVLDQLRPCFEQFHFTPLTFNESPALFIQRVFMGEQLAGFTLGRECRMQDEGYSKSIVTWKDIELTDPSIRRHLSEGMKLTHLGVDFEQVLNCVLSEDGVFSKLKFIAGDTVDTLDDEDPVARQDADFVLLTGTLRQIVEALKKRLGGYAHSTASQ
jgi:recombination associated protein RdgC